MLGRGVHNCCQTRSTRRNDCLRHIAFAWRIFNGYVGVTRCVGDGTPRACRKQSARLERSSNFGGGCSRGCVKGCQRHAHTSNCQYARSGRTAQGQHLRFALCDACGS